MTVSEYIFEFLSQNGCKTVYMVSGSSSMWLTDALFRNEKIEAVCCHHEQAAAMAADCYGRVNAVPGVCLATIGPGATNAITGVAGAYLDSSPMFVLTGQANSRLVAYQESTEIRQHGTQSLLLEEMVSPITKYFCCLKEAQEIVDVMEEAYQAAVSGRKGPVWIDIPIDLQNKQIQPPQKDQSKPTPVHDAHDHNVEGIISHLLKSERPLILAGGGVRNAQATKILRTFSDRFDIPVVTSRGGIDVIASNAPNFIGRPGSYGDRASHFAIQQCDFLLILGCRLSVSTTGYYPQRFGQHAYKIMVDVDQKELDKPDVPLDERLNWDVSQCLKELLMQMNNQPPKCWTAWRNHCVALRGQYPNVLPKYTKETPLNSYYFTKILSTLVSNQANIVVDTGSVCNIASQSWELKEGQRYLISGGLSAMGFWAGILGCVQPGRQLIALSGDGSVQMNVQEFATIHYNHIPVKLFVFQNHGYMLIRHNQHNYMNDRFLGVGPDSGLETPDFCKVAQAYGIKSCTISAEDDLPAKIMEVLSNDEAVICQVEVQTFGDLAPRIASRVMPDGSLKAAEFDDLYPFLTPDDA